MHLNRRVFLLRLTASGTLTATPLGLLTSCAPDPQQESTSAGEPISTLDLTDPIALSKQPYVQITGPTSARLRFETREEIALAVTLGSESGESAMVPTLSEQDLRYSWDSELEIEGYFPDESGKHVLQQVDFEDLEPGLDYEWTVDLGGNTSITGRFRAPPAPGTAFRLGWLSDTMAPIQTQVIEQLTEAAPDLVLHGGDLQYQTNPVDTWRGTSMDLSPLSEIASLHFIVGNHELETAEELEEMYDRLFLGQGDPGAPGRIFAFSYGALRLICLDSESDELADPASETLDWLIAELTAVAEDSTLLEAVVCFHRPLYTLSKHWPSNTIVRDVLHPLFLAYGVRLVLGGHVHAYERFVVDGVHYVNDGGGGAFLYDPSECLSQVEAARPGESSLRVVADQSYGVTLVDVDDAGNIEVTRREAYEGHITDTFVLPTANR